MNKQLENAKRKAAFISHSGLTIYDEIEIYNV